MEREGTRDPLYIIRDWNDHFENNASRKLQKFGWVPLPNKHDGEGYGLLMMMEDGDGPAIFGAFVVIVEVASKCQPRGVLVRDNGQPHTARTIAIKTKMPQALIQRSLDVLSSDETEIGWLEVAETADEVADSPDGVADAADGPPRKEGKKEDKKVRGRAATASRGGAATRRRRKLCEHNNDAELRACKKCRGKGFIDKKVKK